MAKLTVKCCTAWLGVAIMVFLVICYGYQLPFIFSTNDSKKDILHETTTGNFILPQKKYNR